MSNFSNNLINARVSEIMPYLRSGDKILDIGSGNCLLTKRLRELGYNITPIDIVNKSKVKDIQPAIYDGKYIPFSNNSFNLSLLITVLHHTNDPIGILREATRVSNRIIIMEDVYENAVQKYLTSLMDSILNFEFIGHPHSNKTKDAWLEIFNNLNLAVLDKKQHTFWHFFQNGTFYLQKK